jgi:hypothetical protein
MKAHLAIVLFPLLVVLAAGSPGRGQTLHTLTFDELEFQSVDGLSFQGVTFGFQIAGVDSDQAFYHSFGPGSLTYVDDPSLTGDAAAVLRLHFDTPTPLVRF